MPTYDYVCDECTHRFEAFQSMSAKALRKCPKCGRRGLRRLIGTGGGIIFRGSGFYATDYRSKPGAGPGPDGAPKPGGEPKDPKDSKTKGSASSGDKTSGPCG